MPLPRHPADAVLARALRAGRGVSRVLLRRLLALAGRRLHPVQFMDLARVLVGRHEPLYRRTLRDALLAGYLTPARDLLRDLPKPFPVTAVTPATPDVAERGPATFRVAGPPVESPDLATGPGPRRPWRPPPDPPAAPPLGDRPDDPDPLVRYPIIERGARDLLDRQVVTRAEFDRLDTDARRAAFTVARVGSEQAVGAVRQAVVESVRDGGDLRDFRRRLAVELADTPLAPPHLETVYRTNVAAAYGAGLRDLLDAPLIASEFPYVLWSATHDARTRPDHLAMETAGLNGTAIYRTDDPLLRSVWPPAGFNCRCSTIPVSAPDAAAKGVAEARRWLKTGVPPARPAWVASVPVKLPPGWVSAAGIGARV